eukprot:3630785-Alexandrium_andersonii.AAC.1
MGAWPKHPDRSRRVQLRDARRRNLTVPGATNPRAAGPVPRAPGERRYVHELAGGIRDRRDGAFDG